MQIDAAAAPPVVGRGGLQLQRLSSMVVCAHSLAQREIKWLRTGIRPERRTIERAIIEQESDIEEKMA